MRDPKRIHKFCGRLAKAWMMLPDWRFGQLMCNMLGEMASGGRDPFFPEEDEMIKFIEDYCSKYGIAPADTKKDVKKNGK